MSSSSSVAARLEARRAEASEILAEGGAPVKAENATLASGNHAAAAAFLASFEARRKAVEATLSKLAAEREREVATGTPLGSVAEFGAPALASLSAELSSLAADTSAHAHLLPAYDLRATKTALASLEEALTVAQGALQPKKKFAFKKKTAPVAAAAAAVPPLAAANDATAAASASSSTAAAPASAAAAFAEHLPPEDPVTGFYRHSNRVLVKGGGHVHNVDVMLSHLRDCVIFILDPPSALRCHNLERCHVYCAPVSGSVLIYGARDCSFHMATRQLRIHDTHRTRFRLHAVSAPIIEHTDTSAFGELDFAYPALEGQMAQSGLGGKPSRHATVEDFNWLRAQQSPNWRLVTEEESREHPPVTLSEEQVAMLTHMRDDEAVSEAKQQELTQLVQQLRIR